MNNFNYAIMTDPSGDLLPEIRREYSIEMIAGHYTDSGRQEFPSDADMDGQQRENFYSQLRSRPSEFTTSPPSVEEFCMRFEEHLSAGRDVICFTISAQLSGSNEFAEQARLKMSAKYPDRKLYVVDTFKFSAAVGLMAIHASIRRQNGMSVDEVARKAQEEKFSYHQMGWLDDLSFVAKTGRINHAAAFFGSLMGVKPLGDLDRNGKVTVLGKAKGAKQAYEVIVDYIEKTIVNPSEQIVVFAHTNRAGQLDELKKLVTERIKPAKVITTAVYPYCGINVGPGLMACYYTGKPVSDNLEEEKKLMEGILNSHR
ncbi:MAG: DegV family protein [Sphaerochaetaceae bacterium]|nr:DegV family protein [Sphaerochaetaceae bacterium]